MNPKEIREVDVSDFDQDLQKLELVFDINTLDEWAYPSTGNWTSIKTGILHNIHQKVKFNDPAARNIYGIPDDESNFFLQLTDKRFYQLNRDFVLESYSSYGLYTQYSLVDYYRIGGADTYSEFSLPFIGSSQGEYRLQALRYKVADRLFIKATLNFIYGKSYNNRFLNKNTELDWFSVLGGGISLGYESLIGPVNINLGYKNDVNEFNFGVGIGYRHIY